MNETILDFAKLNSQIVADLPEWKKQYDLRVSSYTSEREETGAVPRLEQPILEPRED